MKLQDKAQALARDIGNSALAMRDPASISAMVRKTVDWFSGIDMQLLLKATEVSFDRQFAIKVRGLFFTLQAVARWMGRPKLCSVYGSQAVGCT